ncbi:hypothetical protein [Conchiformibius steedae]|uniref:hypothetical protein n=1 Tax=Conchiformibius steedae TaxID=153493 RepID=UPI0026F14E58|nr:hypothetical protein [Conchiformibius steedae]
MEKIRNLLFCGGLSLLLAACGGQPVENRLEHTPPPPTAEADPNEHNYLTSATFPFDWQQLPASDASTPQVPQQDKITKADLKFETEDVRAVAVEIAKLTYQYRGIVADNRILYKNDPTQRYNHTDGKTLELTRYSYQADMVLHIPREQTQNFLIAIQKYMTVLNSQVKTTQDLLTDMRLKALYDAYQKQQANAIAAHETLTVAEDASQSLSSSASELAAQRQISLSEAAASISASLPAVVTENTVLTAQAAAPAPSKWKYQSEFDALQRRYWQDKIRFATIRLHFYQPIKVDTKLTPSTNTDVLADQYRPGFGHQLNPMFRQGWSSFLSVVLFFIGVWPLALGLPLVWLGWKRWRQSAGIAAAEEEAMLDEPFRLPDEKHEANETHHHREHHHRKPRQRSYFDDDDDDF